MRNLDYKIVFISLCILHIFTLCEGRPLRKRTVSEVQLMHNLGEHKQVQERREWLQMRLRGIHTASLPYLGDLTPEETQYTLNFLEKIAKAKRS
uniref:Parathyroid hormone n=1 Tax=Mastacembelus armatus TaxID=205130 RepID=A0A7N8XWL7_9TELE